MSLFWDTAKKPCKKHGKWASSRLPGCREDSVRNAQPLRKLCRGRARNLLAQGSRNAVEQLAWLLADPLVLPLHQPGPPLRGAEVPAILPRAAAAAGPAQASPWPPAHVGPQPRLLPVRSSVLAVGHVHAGQALLNGRLQQPGGRVSMTRIKGPKCAMISRALSTSASPSRSRGRVVSARLDRAGPNHVEVPRRKRRAVPAPDVAQDGGLKFRHDVQEDDLPARRLEGRPPTWCRRKAPGALAFLKSNRSIGVLRKRSEEGVTD